MFFALSTCIVNFLYSPPINFEWFYWLLYATWYKSPDSYQAIIPTRVNIFVLRLFPTSVIESSYDDIKKLMATAVLESTKKSPKHAVNVFEGGESHELTFNIISPT